MNKLKIAAIIIATQLSYFSIMPIYASGIPTIDAASILQLAANARQQADEALAQLNTAKDAISQAKAQYDHYKSVVEGNDKLGSFLNDPLLNQVLPLKDWRDVYSNTQDLQNLRSKYGLTSSDPKVQAAFDKLLAQAGVLENAYDASNDRIRNADQLRQRLDTVVTPKDREQLALRYQQEQLELQNQQIQLQNAKMLMDEKAKLESQKRSQDFKDYMLRKRPDLPTYN